MYSVNKRFSNIIYFLLKIKLQIQIHGKAKFSMDVPDFDF